MATSPPSTSPSTSYLHLLNLAWPLMLANVAHPLLGIVDTAIMGHTSDTAGLAALAVGVLILNSLFWNFGFLRMSTTALVAADLGRNHWAGIAVTLCRACSIACVMSGLMIIVGLGLLPFVAAFLAPSPATQSVTQQYLDIRLWGMPAVLLNYVLIGYLIATGKTRLLLALQIIMNGINAGLNVLFAAVLGWGIAGIAYGTLIAEYSTLLAGFFIIGHRFYRHGITPRKAAYSSLKRLLIKSYSDTHAFLKTLAEYRDIWLRTLCLLASFFIFTRLSSQFGDAALAANHILLQIIAFSAFFLDSYAHVTESYIGRSIGQKNPELFARVIRRTSLLAAITAIALCLLVMAFGQGIITSLTDINEVQHFAAMYLGFTAIYIACSAGAFQLDGIFIGANATAIMRNASFAATLIFIICGFIFSEFWGMAGLWLAFITYVIARAIFLARQLATLRAQFF